MTSPGSRSRFPPTISPASARSGTHFAGDVAAGEYGYTLDYFAKMLAAEAVDCLQADVTRCGGYSVWRQVAALADAHHRQISGHCAPNLHAHVALRSPTCATSSTSMTTTASRPCSSMAHSRRTAAPWSPTPHAPDTGSAFVRVMRNRTGSPDPKRRAGRINRFVSPHSAPTDRVYGRRPV